MSDTQLLKTEIIKSIRCNDLGTLDNLWLQYTAMNDLDSIFLNQCTELLGGSRHEKVLTDLFELLVDEYMGFINYSGIYEVACILAYHKILSNSFRKPVLTALRNIYFASPNLEKYILYSGAEDTTNFQESFQKIYEYLYFDIGQVFRHDAWGLGMVLDLDLNQNKVVLQFDKKGRHELTFTGGHQFLQKIPDTHFLAVKIRKPESLITMAVENPLNMVKLVAGSYNNQISTTDLKKYLIHGIIDEGDWSKWWAKTKILLKQDPYIDFIEGAKGEIRLRNEPRELHDELFEKFNQQESIEKKYEVIKEFVKNKRWVSNMDTIANNMMNEVIAIYRLCRDDEINRKLVCNYSYELLRNSVKSSLPEFPVSEKELINQSKNVPEMILNLPFLDIQNHVLKKWLNNHHENWNQAIESLLPKTDPRLADSILKLLNDSGKIKEFDKGINQILAAKETNPETYLWVVQQLMMSKWNHTELSLSHYDVMLELLDLMETLQNQKPDSENGKKLKSTVLSRIRKLLEEEDFRLIRDTILDLSLEDARHLRNMLLSNDGLNEAFKTTVDYTLAKVRPDLEKQDKSNSGPLSTKSIHYCTKEMYQQKMDEYKHICTIDLHDVGKALAIARAHGDLRENAEYQSAKQKQKVLFKKADELHDLLDRARLMDPSQINIDHVSFGTKISVENISNGTHESYTILGIWEAEPQNNIISYLSPLASSFLGKSLNEVIDVTLPEGKVQYKISNIENILK